MKLCYGILFFLILLRTYKPIVLDVTKQYMKKWKKRVAQIDRTICNKKFIINSNAFNCVLFFRHTMHKVA